MSALQKFDRLINLMQQIHEADYYIQKAEELGHPHLWQSYEAILEFLVYFCGALNSYAKCFVSAGPGKTRLESSSVFAKNSDQIAKHTRIMELRNKYVSHSDENEFESVRVIEEDGEEELVLKLQYNISFPFDRLYELRELIRFVELSIIDRQASHVAAIEREVGKTVSVLEGNYKNA
jgi:hypothetical protein